MPGLLHDSCTSNLSHLNAPLADLHPSSSLPLSIAVFLQTPSALKFLPSNYDADGSSAPSTEFFACDDFLMYEFKVRRCMRGKSHDWTECPFAHPGEKARRRDPRRVHYSGSPCPDFRKGSCRRGDSCEFSHGVFECWLHPARYRTQACKDGKGCKRRVCFFAHSPEQLRLIPVSIVGSPADTVSMVGSTTHTVSVVGSPSRTVSLEESPPQTVSMAGSPSQRVSMVGSPSRTASMVGLPSTSRNSPSQTSATVGTLSLKSPISLHSSSFNVSPLRQAMAHSFLTSEGYGVGESSLSPATPGSAEDFTEIDGYGGSARAFFYGEVAQWDSSDPDLQSVSLKKGNNEVEEAARLGSLGKGAYELSSYSYGYGFGFPSPTSTLAGHSFSLPPLSPPFSPNSNQTSGTFTPPVHGLHNLHVDDTVLNSNVSDLISIHNTDHMENLAAQHLHSPHSFNHIQPSLRNPQSKHGKVDSTRLHLLLGSPSLLLGPDSLPCKPRQSRWSPLCDNWDYNGHGLGILPYEAEPWHDFQVKIYGKIGEESPIDNLTPDVAWVSELVK